MKDEYQNDVIYETTVLLHVQCTALNLSGAAEYLATSRINFGQCGRTGVSEVPDTHLQGTYRSGGVDTDRAGQWINIHRGETLDREWGG